MKFMENKEAQKKLLVEIMEADAQAGLYKQQTAAEWLALRYHHRQGYLSLEDIAKAKEMEKLQLDKAYSDGVNDERKNTLRYKYFKYKKSIEDQTK
jgi:hypothetical protein